MTESSNLDRLKAAYAAWHDTKGASHDKWLELLGDAVCVRSVGDETAGLEFAGECHARAEVVGYFSGLLEAWDMIHWTPDIFVGDGNQIAMFGRCAWKNKATGKDVEISIAHLWTFADGQAVEMVEVFDSARAAAAAAV